MEKLLAEIRKGDVGTTPEDLKTLSP